MYIVFACEACGEPISVPEGVVHVRGLCTGCGGQITPPLGGYELEEPLVPIRAAPKPLPAPEPLGIPEADDSPWLPLVPWVAAGLGLILGISALGAYVGMRLARTPEDDRPPWAHRPGVLAEAGVRPSRGSEAIMPVLRNDLQPPAPVPAPVATLAPALATALATDHPSVAVGPSDPAEPDKSAGPVLPPTSPGPSAAGPSRAPTVLIPDPEYRPKVDDVACILRDGTPGTTSRSGADDFARKELAGDKAGAAASVRTGAVTMLPRRATFTIVEIREPPPRRPGPSGDPAGVRAAGEFNASHPAGAVVLCRFFDGPAEGRALYVAMVDVGRFVPVDEGSPLAKGPALVTSRSPRKPRPAVDLVAKAAVALDRAEMVEAAGRREEAVRAYRSIVADFPGTPSAAKAKRFLDAMTGKSRR